MRPKAPQGDIVLGAFTPSDPLTAARRERIEKVIPFLETEGIRVVFGRRALRSQASDGASLAEDLMELAENPSVNALIATCGGKTSNALLPHLRYEVFAQVRKPIIGFSDVGVILNAITARTGLVTFYGPNVLSRLEESRDTSLKVLRKGYGSGVRSCSGSVCVVPGRSEGILIGGNLSTFTTSIAGSVYEPRSDRTILFWEAGSKDWRLIDQYLGALAVRGTLQSISGMLIGKIGEDPLLTSDEIAFLKARLQHLRVPVLWMPSFGHGHSENLAWPIGASVVLDASAEVVRLTERFVDED